MTANPQHSLPKGCDDWPDLKAAYRFMSNPGVTPDAIQTPHRSQTRARCEAHSVALSAEIEAEIAQLDEADRTAFLEDMGLHEPAQARVIRACYDGVGLLSFLTCGEDGVRAWTIRKGDTAVEAAGKIHSDIQRGFIRAETVAFEDLRAAGDMRGAKSANKVRLEAKAYVVQDGDVINFRFNV